MNLPSNHDFRSLRPNLDRLLARHGYAAEQVRQEKRSLTAAKARVADTLHAQQIVQGVAETVQAAAHQRIASIVSRCLEAVFGEGEAYQFRIDFSQARGKTEARLLFVRDGLEVDPLTAAGGGAVDVASFALRLATLVLTYPQRRRLLVLDEPFRFVSRGYLPRIRELLLVLAKELSLQVVLVTHSPKLQVGTVIQLPQE